MKRPILSALAVAAAIGLSGPVMADVIFGIGAPLTGPNAAFGAQIQRGAEKAVADINAAGGINGEQIQVLLGDDQSDPKQGVSVANKFAADGVSVMVGPYNSGVAIPTAPVYAENGILQITPGATNPQFTEQGLWNTIRVCGRDDQQGAVAGAYIAEHFKDAKVAVVHDKTPYGQGLAELTKAAMNEHGVNEVMFEGINVGDKDFSALISKMKQAGVTLVYFGGLHTEAGLLVRQMADQGLNVPLMSGDAVVSNELAAIAGDAVANVMNTFAPDPRGRPEAADLVQQFRDEGFEPEAYTLYAYAAVQIVAQAANKAGSNDPQEIAASIKANGPFQTVLGDLSFDEKGDITRPDYVMYQWRMGDDGKYNYFEM